MLGHCALTLISQNVPQQKILGASLGIPPNASKEGEKETGPNGKIFPSFSSFFRTHENLFFPFVRPNGGWRRGGPLGRTKAMSLLLSISPSFPPPRKLSAGTFSRKGDRKKKVRKIRLAFPFLFLLFRTVDYCPLPQNKKAVAQLGISLSEGHAKNVYYYAHAVFPDR